MQESFAALIPALLVMILILAIRIGFAHTHYATIHQFIYEVVASPVRHYGTSYFGALMTVFSITILWSVGINSGSMINGIIRPLWMENQTDNIAAIQAGVTPPHIITEQFFDMIWMGGARRNAVAGDSDADFRPQQKYARSCPPRRRRLHF